MTPHVNNFSQMRPRTRALLLLDLALAVAVILMILTEMVVFFFHVVFILLTFGAFYWRFRAFVLRASLWVTFTSGIVLSAVAAGETQVEELGEIPLLTLILLLVFAIAKQRAKAEDALRKANEELEIRVTERTAELTQVNAELVHEIAMRQQTEETLRDSEERYRLLVELSFEAVVIHCEGKFVHVNPAAAKLLGAVNSEELIGKPLRDFVHPDYWNLVQTRVRHVGEKGIGMPLVEEKLVRVDGTSVDVEVASVPIIYQGQPAVLTVIHNITTRKQAEREREKERARIARDLHDSLGHNLGFLHLKLDQFANDEALGEISGVREGLVQMRQVTKGAYEIVRGILAASLPSNSSDLVTAFLAQARSIGQRGDFKVQLTSEGEPGSLPPVVQQQVLYLFKEALINVERHAKAQHVNISLVWAPEALTITLADDGCGFESEKPQHNGHHGLKIMHERAEEIKGNLMITSRPGVGTRVSLGLSFSDSGG